MKWMNSEERKKKVRSRGNGDTCKKNKRDRYILTDMYMRKYRCLLWIYMILVQSPIMFCFYSRVRLSGLKTCVYIT